jgi:hypothetical protein
LVEGTIPLLGPIHQLLPPADKDQETQVRGSADAEETRGEEPRNIANSHAPGRRAMRDHRGSAWPRTMLS